MTDTFTAEWYDVAMTGEGEPAMLPLEESPWLAVYVALAEMIDCHEDVVDLGCGTGRFIELLRRRGHYGTITGIDWSTAALSEAEMYAGRRSHGGTPRPKWMQEDLADWQSDPGRAGGTVYTCSEVLEHLVDDLGLVERIPPGHRFLFTVPNFHSESHLRTFFGAGQVWERYAGLLSFRSWRLVGTEHKGIHVMESVRRADAW